MTTSGRSWRIWSTARPPSDRTSRSLTTCCVLRRPRMYCATCGTSSTIRSRVWSLLEPLDIGLDDTTGYGSTGGAGAHRRRARAHRGRAGAHRRCAATHWPRRSRTLGDEHGPFGAVAERGEVVAAGYELDAKPGVLGERGELLGADQPQAILADPPARRLALGASSNTAVNTSDPLLCVVDRRSRLRDKGSRRGVAGGSTRGRRDRRSDPSRRRREATRRPLRCHPGGAASRSVRTAARCELRLASSMIELSAMNARP